MRGILQRLSQRHATAISFDIRQHRKKLARGVFLVAWVCLTILTIEVLVGWWEIANRYFILNLCLGGQFMAVLAAVSAARGDWALVSGFDLLFFVVLGTLGVAIEGPDTLLALAFVLAIFLSGTLFGNRLEIAVLLICIITYLIFGLTYPWLGWPEKLGVTAGGLSLLTGFFLIFRFAQRQVERTVAALHERGERLLDEVNERKRVEEELKYLSTHDALTGLFNRAFFQTEIERLQNSRSYPISVMMTDVDGLKKVNDQLGHVVGDELLKRVARLLQNCFRAEDIVARLGGDEFAVLLPETDPTSAKEAINRVQLALQTDRRINPQLPVISLSIGCATARECCQLNEAIRDADDQMYRDKREHKIRCGEISLPSA